MPTPSLPTAPLPRSSPVLGRTPTTRRRPSPRSSSPSSSCPIARSRVARNLTSPSVRVAARRCSRPVGRTGPGRGSATSGGWRSHPATPNSPSAMACSPVTCTAMPGRYSLPTAQRLATWRGDVWRNGLREALRQLDSVPTQRAPLAGMLTFSPDGQTLFAGSRRVWQWDLRALRRPKTASVPPPSSTGWSAPVPPAPPPSGWPSKSRTASVATRL
jgi:hypothetical protein